MIRQDHKNLITIKQACESCAVSRSGYCDWLGRLGRTETDILGQRNRGYSAKVVKHMEHAILKTASN